MNHRFKNSLKKKVIVFNGVLLVMAVLFLLLLSALIFSSFFNRQADAYFNNIASQTENNLSGRIQEIEDIGFNLIIQSEVQSILKQMQTMSKDDAYHKALQTTKMNNMIQNYALYNSNFISLSIFSGQGDEFRVRQIRKSYDEETIQAFTREEIDQANGSSIWRVVKEEEEYYLCVARAIEDLHTMKPIGYINMVLKENYFRDSIADDSDSSFGGNYVVNKEGVVMISSHNEMLGKKLPAYEVRKRIGDYGTEIRMKNKSYVLYTGEELVNGFRLLSFVSKQELQKDIYWFMGIMSVVSVVLVIVASGILAGRMKKIFRPIEQLCTYMQDAGRGNLKNQIAVETDDEVGMLSQNYNHMVENIDILIEQVYKLEIAKRQAELDYLKAQINPHFLYNTLETISGMARIHKNKDIAEVTVALGTLLRATIKQPDIITIQEELTNVRNYLIIQQNRFGDKIKIHWDTDESLGLVLIPNLLLQPFIENAIIHGIEPKLGPGHIWITVKEQEGQILFQVADDGVGQDQETLLRLKEESQYTGSKSYIGIHNVQRRLKIYYGPSCGLYMESRKGLGMRVWFTVPKEIKQQEDQT